MKENQKQIINFVVQVDKNLADIQFVKVGEEIKIIYVDSKGKEYDFRKYASTGTIQSYALALWIFFMTKDSNNKLILIDEIDTSLNPWILQKLLNLSFCKNVQMIFTFHNVGVMNFIDNCLYREQVLNLDKYNSGKIGLTPVSKLWGKNIIKSSELFNYMEGVYGGQPNK